MEKDQAIGAIILIASILGIILYGWLLFFIAPQLVLQISAFIAVVAILVILAWIGWTMATTPPPKTIETEVPTTMRSEQMSEESKK